MHEVTSTSGSLVAASDSYHVEQQEESSTVFSTAPGHVHFHMHMHPPALAPVSVSSCLLQQNEVAFGIADSTTASFGRNLQQLQAYRSCSASQEQSANVPRLAPQQRPADHKNVPCARPLSLAYPAMLQQTSTHELAPTDSSTALPAVQANSVQPADAGPPISPAQKRKFGKRKGVRSAMRAFLLTGAATAAVLAGAATAVAVLSPRVEQLEGRCLQVMQQNKELEQQTASLAAAKQQLEQQLQQLEAAKQQVNEQIQELSSQQGGLAADNAQLRQQLDVLHDSQQQLQHTADTLHKQVASTAEKMDHHQQQQLVEQRRQEAALVPAPAGSSPKLGDLSVQVTVPGFTDALVSRIGDAELVPQFAEALVTHVKQTGLVQHAVDSIVGKVGQTVSGAICPWKWKIAVPWQKTVKHDEST